MQLLSEDIVRSGAHVTPTRTIPRWYAAVWPTLGCLFVVGVIALATWSDKQADQREAARLLALEAAEQRGFEAGRELGHAEMVASAEAAWQAAGTEAERCARGKP